MWNFCYVVVAAAAAVVVWNLQRAVKSILKRRFHFTRLFQHPVINNLEGPRCSNVCLSSKLCWSGTKRVLSASRVCFLTSSLLWKRKHFRVSVGTGDSLSKFVCVCVCVCVCVSLSLSPPPPLAGGGTKIIIRFQVNCSLSICAELTCGDSCRWILWQLY
jgi:hypothetical protein